MTWGGSTNVRDKKEHFGVKTVCFGADWNFTHRVGAGRRKKIDCSWELTAFFFLLIIRRVFAYLHVY